jgi:hypothetical protein
MNLADRRKQAKLGLGRCREVAAKMLFNFSTCRNVYFLGHIVRVQLSCREDLGVSPHGCDFACEEL